MNCVINNFNFFIKYYRKICDENFYKNRNKIYITQIKKLFMSKLAFIFSKLKIYFKNLIFVINEKRFLD